MEKINVAQLLKDCPKGMELYSPIFGTVYFEGIRDTGRAILIDVTTSCNTSVQFYSDGKFNTYYSESEVTLFPSKSQRDWSKFQIPFKDGDILYVKAAFDWICIYKESEDTENIYKYVAVLRQPNATGIVKDTNCLCCRGDISEIRLATEEEKQKLFDAIKSNGYKWNEETKTLEKLIEPKFKVGDRIKNKNSGICDKVIKIFEDCYLVESCLDEQATIGFDIQDNWVLAPNKFDISTLKPFDKVLVRDSYKNMWCASIFSHTWKDKYFCIGAWYNQCIPYEANKELLGTTNDCGWFYKNWEEE